VKIIRHEKEFRHYITLREIRNSTKPNLDESEVFEGAELRAPVVLAKPQEATDNLQCPGCVSLKEVE
jgi:hypothetical protein